MPKIIVSDTSSLILLNKIKRIEILKLLFGKITITQVIAEEFGETLPDFISIENPKDNNYEKILKTILDSGEASAIALALEKNDCLLIIDDLKARKEANKLKLDFTGTIGILIVAKKKKIIPAIKEILIEIEQTNFRISDHLKKEAIKICNE